jgi:uncharacterized protein
VSLALGGHALLATVTFTPWQLLLVFLAAVGAGIANALAGGGTFITFPTLTAVGLSPTAANITNTVALSPGYLGGTVAQRADLEGQGRRTWIFLSVGALGGVIGGALLLLTREKVFATLVPFLILGATILLAAQERLRAWVASRAAARPPTGRAVEPWAIALAFTASIYGGYFGAGLGIVLLAVLGLGVRDSLTRVNALKQATSFSVNVSAAVFFVFSGKVAWAAAAVMAVGALAGGVAGGRLAGTVREETLRRIVVTIGFAVALVFFVKAF